MNTQLIQKKTLTIAIINLLIAILNINCRENLTQKQQNHDLNDKKLIKNHNFTNTGLKNIKSDIKSKKEDDDIIGNNDITTDNDITNHNDITNAINFTNDIPKNEKLTISEVEKKNQKAYRELYNELNKNSSTNKSIVQKEDTKTNNDGLQKTTLKNATETTTESQEEVKKNNTNEKKENIESQHTKDMIKIYDDLENKKIFYVPRKAIVGQNDLLYHKGIENILNKDFVRSSELSKMGIYINLLNNDTLQNNVSHQSNNFETIDNNHDSGSETSEDSNADYTDNNVADNEVKNVNFYEKYLENIKYYYQYWNESLKNSFNSYITKPFIHYSENYVTKPFHSFLSYYFKSNKSVNNQGD